MVCVYICVYVNIHNNDDEYFKMCLLYNGVSIEY